MGESSFLLPIFLPSFPQFHGRFMGDTWEADGMKIFFVKNCERSSKVEYSTTRYVSQRHSTYIVQSVFS